MKKLKKYFCPLLIILFHTTGFAKDCPQVFDKYGDDKSYQNAFCKIKITADATGPSSSRDILFTDTGLIQVFTNFPGSKLSNSTGARVYYLFPTREEKKISTADEKHLSVQHPSGVNFDFDKNGKMSSSDVKMKVSNEINANNKSGVEIENYPMGVVIDLGYRIGNTPTLNMKAVITVTDKNNKKCTLENSEFNKVEKGEAVLIYKTNETLYKFLSKKCPNLDLSNFVKLEHDKLKMASRPAFIGAAPSIDKATHINDEKREPKGIIYDSVYDKISDPVGPSRGK